ncbi:TetR/AcrR family transcriptional regulator [Vallitalea okinawensis]|uniref:TetR/AcrR family transcriptional regulator n=1 Tax=Vallitalea okinawensis TaxID=2078660 RepID=UPI000CFAA422|nr:TetR/AcrR family transcriptional regulator [Vallitalea okinawensis]
MPKIVTEKKKEIARKRIKQKTENLIEEIGIKNITITKICDAVPIGKGTFYYYFNSKEVLLYEVIKEKEENLMKQMLDYCNKDISIEEKVIKTLTEVYIGKSSIVNTITTEEFEKIIAKLPPELIYNKELRGKNFFESSMKLLGINPLDVNMGVLGELLDGINFMASRPCKHGEEARREALQILIKGLAAYIAKRD